MHDTVKILGVPFDRIYLNDAVNIVEDKIDSNREKIFHIITGNPEIVLHSAKEQLLSDIIEDSDLITPDGIGVILASRWKRDALPERVTGYDLLIKLLERGNEKEWSFYLFGADEETNRRSAKVIKERYPNAVICGRRNGFFSCEDEKDIIDDIEKAKPDILVVALGAPRAEKWIYNNKSKLKAKVALGVGGSLDVIAGKVKRAPLAWQRLNLEWLYRLLSQPSRIRRQVVLPVFALKALGEAVKENMFGRGKS